MYDREIGLDILNKKKNMLNDILEISKKTVFDDEIDDVEIYISMIERREDIFNNIKLLDNKINSKRLSSIWEDESFLTESALIRRDIKDLSEKIIKFDVEFRKKSEKFSNMLKDKIKTIKQSKNRNNKYKDSMIFEESRYFDSSKL